MPFDTRRAPRNTDSANLSTSCELYDRIEQKKEQIFMDPEIVPSNIRDVYVFTPDVSSLYHLWQK